MSRYGNIDDTPLGKRHSRKNSDGGPRSLAETAREIGFSTAEIEQINQLYGRLTEDDYEHRASR